MNKGYFICAALSLLSTATYSQHIPHSSSESHCLIHHTSHKICPENSTLDAADSFVEKQQFVRAANVYRCFLKKHPREKSAYIDYADVERIVQNYCQAMDILNQYARIFGEDEAYFRVKARIYADAGYYNSSLIDNTPLRAKHPKNDYIVATQASALYQSNRPAQGIGELNYLEKIASNSDEIPDLEETIREPLQNNVSIGYRYADLYAGDFPMYIPSGPQYIHQSDTVSISRVPFIVQKYFNSNTSLLFKAQYEYYHADQGSGLETINGKTHIQDMEYYVGFNSITSPTLQTQAFIGDLAISNHHNFIVYNIAENILLSERFALSVEVFHELFRPLDIYNGSPLLISLGILETTGRTHLNYKLDLQSILDIDARYGSLSDGNAYTRFMLEPSRTVYNSDKTAVSLVLDLEWLRFNDVRLFGGYYSPSLYQLYQVGAQLDYLPTDNLTFQVYGAAGTVKDNFTPNFGFAGYLAGQGKYRLKKNLDLVFRAEYIYEEINPIYNEVDVYAGLNLRFG